MCAVVIARARFRHFDVWREDGRRVAGAWGGFGPGYRDARKNVWLQREALVAAQSRTHENTKLLDEGEPTWTRRRKAAAFKAWKRRGETGERRRRRGRGTCPGGRGAPESTLQIRVRVLSQKAEDLKAEERKVTTMLEQAADVADRAAKVLATRPETDAAELRKAEDAMCERDEGVRLVAEQRNALETCILELRAAKNGSHTNFLRPRRWSSVNCSRPPRTGWSDEASNADAIAQKKERVLADAKALVPEYFEKVEAERLATEKELEKEAATATNEDDDDEEGRTGSTPTRES